MRQTSSGWRCSSTDWFGWNGGSNQNQRSAGKSAAMRTSAIRKRSRKLWPRLSGPSALRTGCGRRRRRPAGRSAGDTGRPGVSTVEHHAVAVRLDAGDPVLPAHLEFAQRPRAVEQVALDVVLLQVDEGRALVARPRAAGRSGRAARRAGTRGRCSSQRPSRSCARRSRGGRRSPACAWQSRSRASRSRAGRRRRAAPPAMPRCARSIAGASPTGPAPATSTGCRTGAAASWSGLRTYGNVSA